MIFGRFLTYSYEFVPILRRVPELRRREATKGSVYKTTMSCLYKVEWSRGQEQWAKYMVVIQMKGLGWLANVRVLEDVVKEGDVSCIDNNCCTCTWSSWSMIFFKDSAAIIHKTLKLRSFLFFPFYFVPRYFCISYFFK